MEDDDRKPPPPPRHVVRESSFAQSFYRPQENNPADIQQPQQQPQKEEDYTTTTTTQHPKQQEYTISLGLAGTAAAAPAAASRNGNHSDDDMVNYPRPRGRGLRHSIRQSTRRMKHPPSSSPPPPPPVPQQLPSSQPAASRHHHQHDVDDDHWERRLEPTPSAAAASIHVAAAAAAASLPSETLRQTSWFEDAEEQGGEDWERIINGGGDNDGFGDDEVLQQYRIMALHEARLRVKENTGFDMAEYEKRSKTHAGGGGGLNGSMSALESTKASAVKKTKIRLPDPRLWSSTSSSSSFSHQLKLEEPPLPAPRWNTNYLQQKDQRRVPELCPGVEWTNSTQLSKEEHVVRCLHCSNKLRVNIQATLVSCPVCSTVSPTSSTRR